MNYRLNIYRDLCKLTTEEITDLESVASFMGMPPGNKAPNQAPISNRVYQMLTWAEWVKYLDKFYNVGLFIQAGTIRLLSALPQSQFEGICFALAVPVSDLPSAQAPQKDRACALLAWCAKNDLSFTLRETIQNDSSKICSDYFEGGTRANQT